MKEERSKEHIEGRRSKKKDGYSANEASTIGRTGKCLVPRPVAAQAAWIDTAFRSSNDDTFDQSRVDD